jgi:cysteine desulfurase
MEPIYLDHNATTKLDPRVALAIDACHRAGHVNPASPHQAGRRARRVLEEARESIARVLCCRCSDTLADRVIFTSGGTESNNLAIFGLAGPPPGRVIISSIEHPSVTGPAEQLQRCGFDLQRLPVSRDGVVHIGRLRELLTKDTRLVSVMLGNHETGVLQPVQDIAALCAAAGVPLHTDAVQTVGKVPVDFRQLSVTALSLTAHKFHGPVGIGALVVRPEVQLRPLLWGGFQQAGLRPGTEPVALAVGLQKALELWQQESDARLERITVLRDRLENSLRAEFAELVVSGAGAARLPHTTNIAFPGLDRQALLMALDLAGVACSTGSACASGSSDPSPVLLAMGLPTAVVNSALRFSLGAFTTDAEVEEAVRRISQIVKDLQRRKSPL